MVRFDFQTNALPWQEWARWGAVLLAARSVAYEFFRVPRFSWQCGGLSEGVALTMANAGGSALTAATLSTLPAFGLSPTTASILVIEWMLVETLLLGAAAALSGCQSYRVAAQRADRGRILIYGAGRQGRELLREIRCNARLPFEVIGFVDDDSTRRNTYLAMTPVLGSGAELGRLAELHRVEQILVAISSPTPEERSRIHEMASYSGRPYRFIQPWARGILRKPPISEEGEPAIRESTRAHLRRTQNNR